MSAMNNPKIIRRLTFFFIALLLATVSAGLLFPDGEVEAAASRPAAPSANFPMGADISAIIPRLAEPGGKYLADDLATLNLGYVRFEFRATDPAYLRVYDRAIGQLESRGIRVMAVLIEPWDKCRYDMRQNDLSGFTGWVRETYLKGCGSGSQHQLGFDELTARYPYIQHWQIWNEPNVCGYLPSDLDACGYGLWRRDISGGEKVGVRLGMQKFGVLLATVYANRINKQVKIVTGGILSAHNCSPEYGLCGTEANPGPENCYELKPWENFSCDAGTNLLMNSDAVQGFKRQNNRLPFDILGLHPYQAFAWANGYVPPAVYVPRDIALNVRRFVDKSYPIWITEWGFNLVADLVFDKPPVCRYPTPATNKTGCEENMAALMESVVSGLNSRPELNIANLFWFNLMDDDPALQAGLIAQDGRKRAAWYSLQTIAKAQGQASQQKFRAEILQSIFDKMGSAFKSLINQPLEQHRNAP